MKSFKYETLDASGQGDSGIIQAASRAEAEELLQSRGNVVTLTPVGRSPLEFLNHLRTMRFESGPSRKDVMMFTTQLAVMLKAGLNLRDALRGIADRMPAGKFQVILQQITDAVEGGRPLSTALSEHSIFPPMCVHMVRAAEMSGTMAHMLERVAEYLEQQSETRSMVRAAMIYPCIIFVMAITATVFLLAFALPKFTTIFQGKESLLPTPTIILLAISGFMHSYWHMLLGGVLVLVLLARQVAKSQWGRPRWDTIKLRIPVFGPMCHALYITQGLRAMGELIGSGAPMLDSVLITADISGNTQYERMWHCVHDRVKEGSKIARSLADQPLMPASVVQMISAGEESGSMSQVLNYVAEYHSKVLKRTIKALTTIIEPVMIVVMGLVVGFIAMSILLPIFKISTLLK